MDQAGQEIPELDEPRLIPGWGGFISSAPQELLQKSQLISNVPLKYFWPGGFFIIQSLNKSTAQPLHSPSREQQKNTADSTT